MNRPPADVRINWWLEEAIKDCSPEAKTLVAFAVIAACVALVIVTAALLITTPGG